MDTTDAPTSINVRRARLEDAGALGAIHVNSWRAAYRGLVEQSVLDALSIDARSEQWRGWLATPTTPAHRHHVLEVDGVVAGFAVTRPSVEEGAADDAFNLAAIYLSPEYFGRGLAAPLLAVALGEVAAQGARTVSLWVLEANARARKFYENWGFARDGGELYDERLRAKELRYTLALG